MWRVLGKPFIIRRGAHACMFEGCFGTQDPTGSRKQSHCCGCRKLPLDSLRKSGELHPRLWFGRPFSAWLARRSSAGVQGLEYEEQFGAGDGNMFQGSRKRGRKQKGYASSLRGSSATLPAFRPPGEASPGPTPAAGSAPARRR